MPKARKARKTAVSLGIALTFATPFSIAASAEPPDLANAQSVIASVAPELVGVDSSATDLTVSSSADSRSRVSNQNPTVSVTSPVDQRTTRITVVGARGEAAMSGEVSVFDTGSAAVKAYVQPSPNGVRLLTAINSRSASREYSYRFNTQPGTKAVPGGGGILWLEQPDGTSGGMIAPPWARDAAGRQLPTHYTWDDNTLTQTIDLDAPSITFPVLADPNWGYSFATTTGNTTPQAGWSLLHNCFNCYFPVAGAPHDFPTLGSLLPLRVGWAGVIDADFTCLMDEIEPLDRMWKFAAWGNHVDGFGSWIAFGLHSNALHQNVLEVGAFIVNDFPAGIPNPIYEEGAKMTWQSFANNLANG